MIPISMPSIGPDEQAAVQRVLSSGMLASGEEVRRFEERFADYVGTGHAIAVGSGTAGLIVGLLALGVGTGDEVIVPSFTFAATANSVRICGATPVFADVDEQTFCLDPKAVEAAIGPRTVAIMPVHLYGHPADMRALGEIARCHGLAIVEDAAQAHGADLDGQRTGSFGEFGVFSFYPTKNMTTGEGGMITTSNEALARRCRLFRNQGMEQRYEHEVVGLNERMTEIEAAIGNVQLERLPGFNAARQANARRYLEALSPDCAAPTTVPGATHVYHQFTVQCGDRAGVVSALEQAGIGYGIYYPKPVHQQAPYREQHSQPLDVTERLAGRVLSLPVGPHCTESDVDLVVKVVNEAVAQ